MSNLINKTRLQKFAEGLWTKIKERYDDAFVNAEITQSTDTEKKIKFTKKKGGATVDVNLQDYARLQDRNEFKKDVSVDNVGVVNNSHIGTRQTVTSRNRGLGFRQLTTSAFVDGHVDHIKIYLGDNATGNATFKVWAITKNATDRTQDRVNAVAFSGNLSIETVQENGQAKKIVNIPINKSYATETYFILRSTTHDMLVVDGIDQKYHNDAINLGDTNQPQDTPGSQINWDSNAVGANTAIMYLYGRESIGSLAEKLKQTQADGSNYVLKSETTATSAPNKVVKLDEHGKLNKNMLPSIAINDYFSVTAFTDEQLRTLTYENGDVVVVENGEVVSKRYLCIHKGATNSTTEFVELNSKDGVVSTVNGKAGAVELDLLSTTSEVKLTIGNGSGTPVEKVIPIISEADIDSIISNLQ